MLIITMTYNHTCVYGNWGNWLYVNNVPVDEVAVCLRETTCDQMSRTSFMYATLEMGKKETE